MAIHRIYLLSVVLVVTLLVAACGGGTKLNYETGLLSLRADSGAAEIDQAALDAQWAATLANPGTPGVDYDPRRITVSYLPGAKVPAGLSPATGASAAASMPNALIRVNKQFEALTDAIATKYGLPIEQQVYWRSVNVAGFAIPEGVDGDQLIADIRRDFAGSLEYVTYSRLFHKRMAVNDPWYNMSNPSNQGQNHPQWGQKRIGCTTAWDYSTGEQDIMIAILDTGCRLSHQELTDVLDPAVAFPSANCNVTNNTKSVTDNDGHGTFIAGITSGIQNNNRTITGVAPGCRALPIKIANGGSTPDVFMFAGAVLAVQLEADIINLSWGGPNHTPTLQNLTNEVVDAGRLLFCAAGNDGVTTNDYPAFYPKSFTVGSTTPSDARSDFSNFGSYVDIAAPGQRLGTSGPGADDEYVLIDGTSFSAPMAAAVAALMWSANPTLTNADIREIMIETGVPTTGFTQGEVRRIDAGAALAAASGVGVKAPRIDRLVHSGTVTLTPTIAGTADRVEAWVDGTLVQTLTSAPWDFSIDTSTTTFKVLDVEFRAFAGADQATDTVPLLVDNTAAAFPILEDFEDGNLNFLPYDGKHLTGTALNNLFNIPAGDQGPDTFAANGPGSWQQATIGAHKGGLCGYCGKVGGNYGAYEIDNLVSRRLTLTANNPTAVFYHHFNVEDGGQDWDRAWVFVTTDDGLTFTPATLKGGGQAFFSGLLSGYSKVEIDLAAFKNQTVRLVLSLQTDEQAEGEDQGQTSGWWVDSITVATGYSEDVPQIGGVSVDSFSVYGTVPSLTAFDVQVVQPTRVSRVRYILDCVPIGVVNPYDKVINVTSDVGAPWQAHVPLPTTVPNQLAQLRVQYFDAQDNAGPELSVPVYVFNLPGDTNADGTVNQADLDNYTGKIGLGSSDAGYVPFLDSDLDGTVTEADASAVGYNWGEDS